ncbi:hypothetical protein AgCh_022314 [Apium graveolens]
MVRGVLTSPRAPPPRHATPRHGTSRHGSKGDLGECLGVSRSSHTVPIPSLTSPPSPQPTAVVIISRFVLKFLKHHDEEIMMKLKSLCDVPPRINEYMECYGLLLEKFKVLEKGNKFIVSFSLFVSIFMIFASLVSYLGAGLFDHVYYGVKMLERMTNKSDKQDLKAPILFKVVEIFKILLILGYTLIMWLYSKITRSSFTPLLQFLETIIKELEDES